MLYDVIRRREKRTGVNLAAGPGSIACRRYFRHSKTALQSRYRNKPPPLLPRMNAALPLGRVRLELLTSDRKKRSPIAPD